MSKKDIPAHKDFNEILLYTTPNGHVKVEVFLRNETFWLTQLLPMVKPTTLNFTTSMPSYLSVTG